MKSSRKITLLFTLIFIGLTVSEAQAQLKDSPVDTTFDASEIILSKEMLRNSFLNDVRFNTIQTQTIFDKPITKAFLVLGKTITNSIVDNNFTPKSYSGFSPKNTAELYDGYHTFERTNEFPRKRSYFLPTNF
ncbi:MAG: hypothetical protein WEA58_15685 [Balneolaceae bacterium]